tara:strand:+ start:111 stop:494 length:384 start_codon:yes stop_codon:yes gene_type:complete
MNGKHPQTATNDDLAAALAQFNNGVTTSRELDKQSKAINKAEKRRDMAAQKLKELMESDAEEADRAILEEEYRMAVEDWTRLTNPNTNAPEIDGGQTVETVDTEIELSEESSEDRAQEDEANDQETA